MSVPLWIVCDVGSIQSGANTPHSKVSAAGHRRLGWRWSRSLGIPRIQQRWGKDSGSAANQSGVGHPLGPPHSNEAHERGLGGMDLTGMD